MPDLFQEPDISNGVPAEASLDTDTEYVLISRDTIGAIFGKLEEIQERQALHTNAVNQFGQMLDHVVQTVAQAGQMFAGGGGLKALMGMMGGKSDG